MGTAPPDGAETPATRPTLGRRINAFWLRFFFGCTLRAPWCLGLIRPVAVHGTWWAAGSVRRGVRANLRRVLGPRAGAAELNRTGRAVVASFYDFVCEVGANRRRPLGGLLDRIEAIQGGDAFLKTRQSRRGAVLVTAHFGNFEVGLAAMREKEDRVHVVFQRDAMTGFETIRHELHRQLGILETPIDDGLASWMALRDALQSDAVVMLQGDRVMPGQRGLDVPFFDGHLPLPVGPAKLAMMTGAPLIPVFAVRVPGGRVRIVLGAAIEVPDAAAVEPALQQIARAIQAVVAQHPEQWHVLQPAFAEDLARPPAYPPPGGRLDGRLQNPPK